MMNAVEGRSSQERRHVNTWRFPTNRNHFCFLFFVVGGGGNPVIKV